MNWEDKYKPEQSRNISIVNQKINQEEVYIVSLNNKTNVAINIDSDNTIINVSFTNIEDFISSQPVDFCYHHKDLLARPGIDIQNNEIGYISRIKDNGKSKLVTIKKEGNNYVIHE